ncbi:flavanone 3-dioxygenase 2 [Malania oleifera]|uniref:flavanone 3-dioxygenase 2 n=1 Tax=Malania oleifera TaxID=397392 RepID=UPI0025AE5851|nr:flavanone 3-dioxygenase 2 [Malania oleifera]
MAVSPESRSEKPIDFRAPPPSPIASGRRSCVTNDDVLTEFLEQSLRVPDLILPDRVFPRQRSAETPPKIDLESLESPENDSVSSILESVSIIGCFQLINHGIPQDLIRSVSAASAGIFRVPPEKKKTVSRSPENPYGFEEIHGDEEGEESEEFVWGRDEGLKLEMEGIWPMGYSNFSDKMECLSLEIEKVAEKILKILGENSRRKLSYGCDSIQEQEEHLSSICYLYKHCHKISNDVWVSSLRYDVIRMLISGSDFSHALCLHVCEGSSEFHVYSKKGWISFSPEKDAIIITVGDQIQAWIGGKSKHVLGRPIYRGEEESISMAFLCSSSPPPPPPIIYSISSNPNSSSSSSSCQKAQNDNEKTVSLAQQAILALLFILFYHFSVYIYKKL